MLRALLLPPLIAALTACAAPALSQTSSRTQMPDQTPLTLERLYASPSLSGPSPRSVKFSPDGRRVTFLKPRAEDQSRYDLWQFDVATGAQTMLVDSALVDPDDTVLSEAEKALRERKRIAGIRGIADYDWGTADTILVPAGGDLHLVTLGADGPTVRQLTNTPEFEYDAKVSPAGRYVSFIRNEALYAIELATGKEQRLSPLAEPDKAIGYGIAEYVAQEEMDRYNGYWWSSDDRYIAYTKVDESGVDIIPRFDIEADEVTVINQRYPRAGRPNARVSLIVRDMAAGTDAEIAHAGPDDYLVRVNWSKGDLWFQTMNRDQTVLAFQRATTPGWKPSVMFTEENPRWVNLSGDFVAADDGLLLTSEADGVRQIYWRNPETGEQRQITFGTGPVDRLLGYDAQSRTIWFEGFLDTPLESHLYAASIGWTDAEIEARGAARLPDKVCIDTTPQSARAVVVCPEVRRVTPEGRSAAIALAPDAQSYIATSSSPDQPPQTGLYRIDGSHIAWIEENAIGTNHPYAPYLAGHVTPEYGMLSAEDNQTLYYSILKPPGFDPAKKYPVIIEVYGGPHVQTVERKWGALSDQFLARQGFIVFRLDNRGSYNRGRRFEDVIYRQTGAPEVRDQLKGVEWLKSQPFVDPDRIAIEGWSYGGYMTLMTLAQAPEGTFAAAAAGASVTDWALYDTFYTERYMDTPQDNPDGYAASSVFAHIDGLSRAPLLLMHGMADDNVTFDNTTRLMAELQKRGIVFDLMTYPGQRHGIRGEDLQVHLMRTRMAFLKRHLKQGE